MVGSYVLTMLKMTKVWTEIGSRVEVDLVWPQILIVRNRLLALLSLGIHHLINL